MNTIETLKGNLRGRIVQPGDADYDTCRKVYNGMIDREPRYIVYCENVSDVIAAVQFGRENEIRTSIRGGGHNAAGLGVCDDGLVIDLSNIDYTYVDPVEKTVRVGGGAVWGQVDHATQAFGMAVPSGIVATTGVGGLTLGGGHGYLSRKYGLTIDSLLEADLVLADGRYVKASKQQNEDLFWAIRGGGGNFGVVTSFKFRLHEVSMVYAGPTFWEMDRAEEVMQWYREYILTAPNEVYGFLALMKIPPAPPFPESLHNKTMCGIVWCYSGPMEKAETAFKPIRDVGNIVLDMVGSIPYAVLQSMFDPMVPPGLLWYWKADFMTEWSNESIRKNIEHAYTLPTTLSSMHLYPVNGAVHEVNREDTAWSYREANWSQVVAGIDPEPVNKEAISSWAKKYWEDAVHPYSSGGAYVNFMMDEGDDRVRATYRNNYQRLAEIKTIYDPNNFFNVNQNIKPGR
jgi:UDP-N-acetylenolpyruvoylglucosamine reductase